VRELLFLARVLIFSRFVSLGVFELFTNGTFPLPVPPVFPLLHSLCIVCIIQSPDHPGVFFFWCCLVWFFGWEPHQPVAVHRGKLNSFSAIPGTPTTGPNLPAAPPYPLPHITWPTERCAAPNCHYWSGVFDKGSLFPFSFFLRSSPFFFHDVEGLWV